MRISKQLRTFGFTIQSEDRALKAFEPRRLDATCTRQTDELPFLWYVAYKFHPTRGRPVVIRIRNAEGERLSWLSFYVGLFTFRWLDAPRPRPRTRTVKE
jgi:hypothetical protein